MAEISIVNFFELDKEDLTLSSEFYNPFIIELDRKYKNSTKVFTLENLSLKNGIKDFGSFSLYNYIEYLNKSDINGIPFLRVVDLSENYINYKNSVKITIDSHNLLKKSQVEVNNILFSIIGTLGIATISTENIICNSNQSLAKINIDENKVNPYYVTIYLNSEIGKSLSLRGESGGLQKHITLGRTKKIPVYLLNRKLQDEIGDLYLKSLELMKEAIYKYEKAEKQLIGEIGLNELNS